MKRFYILLALIALLMMTTSVSAKSAHEVMIGTNVVVEGNIVTVPIEISNQDGLMAIDIPLKFSEGVTLKDVSFENTRVSYFDLQIPVIDNNNHTVVIGLLTQMSPVKKPDLAEGSGLVANLIFEVTDPSVSEIKIEQTEMSNPRHAMMFIYHELTEDGKMNQSRVELDFQPVTVALSANPLGFEGVPDSYALSQNYPNPFNPTTEIAFDLPAAVKVNLSIFNVLGQRVVTLVDERLDAGNHTVTWNSTNSGGNTVSSGIYFYRISAGSFSESRKMMLLK